MVVQSPQMCWTWGVLRLHGCAHAWEVRAQLDVIAGLGVCCACMGSESATGCKCWTWGVAAHAWEVRAQLDVSAHRLKAHFSIVCRRSSSRTIKP
jgi:hypothetical protein